MARVRVEADGFLAATKTDMRNALRESSRFAGLYFHRNFKATRFTRRGARLLKFQPRSGESGSNRRFKGSYSEAKLKKKANGQGVRAIGEVKPNVWSGESRRRAMASRKVEAKAQSSGRGSVDIIINAPALNFKNPKSKVHPRVEIERTAQAEDQAIDRVATKDFERRIFRRRRRKTVKGR